MEEVPRLLLMLVLAGAALTVLGAVAIRINDEGRRIKRGLKLVLGAEPHAVIVARGRGRGAGFDFGAGRMAVAWDAGAWCLIYRIEELIGAELIVDGQVAARAHRGEDRRALDVIGGAEKEVRLRLLFDDPRHPDFDLVLWVEADEGRRGAMSADDAAQEANRWIARTEAILRRPLPRREAPAAAPPLVPEDEDEDEEDYEDEVEEEEVEEEEEEEEEEEDEDDAEADEDDEAAEDDEEAEDDEDEEDDDEEEEEEEEEEEAEESEDEDAEDEDDESEEDEDGEEDDDLDADEDEDEDAGEDEDEDGPPWDEDDEGKDDDEDDKRTA